MCIVFFGCPELTTVSHTGLCLTKKIEWRKQARFNEEPKILLTLILCMWDSMWKKNKIKVITQWGGGIGKQIKKLSLFLYHVIAFQKEFSSESLGNVRRTQLLLTRAATRKGDSSVEKREMDGFSPGRQGWRGHLSNYRSLTTLLYNLVSLFPGWSEILCYKLPIVAKCELILGSFSTTVNICLF